MTKTLTALLITLTAAVASAGPVRVIETDAGGYQLLREGQPFFIKGAGGNRNLDLLVESGGNSFRTWGNELTEAMLDEAHERGLAVTVGIWLQHPRHGFDYSDEAAVERQREHVRQKVLRFKDHPAVLMWGLGNEVELEDDPLNVFPEIERIAQIVKQLDPDHPTMTVIAGAARDKVEAFVRLCPSIDVLGVNSYGSAHRIPDDLLAAGYDGPYAVTEFGPRGWWESPTADWGAAIEPTSAEKVRMYRRGYEGVTRGRGRAVGSYVFLWGQKQETTETWFGMFLKDGSRTPRVDAMRELWTGETDFNHAPVVSGIRSAAALARVRPGSMIEATVDVEDRENDALEVEWVIIGETTDQRSGGDPERAPPRYADLTIEQGIEGRLRAPDVPGPYRLFVFVRDPHNGVGTANVPFYVE